MPQQTLESVIVDLGVVLPDRNDRPTVSSQSIRDSPVASFVSRELFEPKILIGFGHSMMQGTAMPKTSVDEDDDAFSRQHEVGTACKFRRVARGAVAERSQLALYRQLGFEAITANPRHEGRTFLRIHASMVSENAGVVSDRKGKGEK